MKYTKKAQRILKRIKIHSFLWCYEPYRKLKVKTIYADIIELKDFIGKIVAIVILLIVPLSEGANSVKLILKEIGYVGGAQKYN